ncbi:MULTISPECIES: hypothetical protein [unclassified Luteococcus]|uniref:hypothetical protein n=1 Tax=unclassified Luteococcus TaxID=2639923 RepID=UPI00313E028A
MNANKLTDKQWLDEMVIELRLREINGTAIGDAVAAVETHCAESGERPAEAFGNPREYARALDFAPSQISDTSAQSWAKVLAPIAAGMVGVSLAPGIVRALFDHSSVTISWGDLAALATLALVVAVSIKYLHALLQNKLTGILFFGGAVAAMAMLPILLPGTASTLPVVVAVALTIACLVASVLGLRWQRHALDDPIIDPRTRQRTSPLLSILTIWLFPIVAAATGLITAIPLWMAK